MHRPGAIGDDRGEYGKDSFLFSFRRSRGGRGKVKEAKNYGKKESFSSSSSSALDCEDVDEIFASSQLHNSPNKFIFQQQKAHS